MAKMTFSRPTILCSRCLGFAPCRYNAATIPTEIVDKLKAYAEFITVCPESDIGLGVPRDPIRIVSVKGLKKLVQPKTGREVTSSMEAFCEQYLATVDVDGFILKGRSPSCGIKDVKVYLGDGDAAATEKGSGYFGGKVMEKYPDHAVEEEGRLLNTRIREHFLTSIFAYAGFRDAIKTAKISTLVRYHSVNKLLFMGYNQSQMRLMGRIVANREKLPFESVAKEYGTKLRKVLMRAPRRQSNINVLMHAFGYFSERLAKDEKKQFLDTTDEYREGRIPLVAVTTMLQSWAARFNEGYIKEQSYLEPYPKELIEVDESDKERYLAMADTLKR